MNLSEFHLNQKRQLEEKKRLQQFDAEDKVFGNVDEDYEMTQAEQGTFHVEFIRYEFVPGSASNNVVKRVDKFSQRMIDILEAPGKVAELGWDEMRFLHDPRKLPQQEVPKAKRAVKKK